MKIFPCFHRKIKVNETDEIKRRDTIIYKIFKQIPLDNDKWYVKCNRDSDTFTLERKTKKIILIDNSDDEEGNKKRNMTKRKNAESVDEMNQK